MVEKRLALYVDGKLKGAILKINGDLYHYLDPHGGENMGNFKNHDVAIYDYVSHGIKVGYFEESLAPLFYPIVFQNSNGIGYYNGESNGEIFYYDVNVFTAKSLPHNKNIVIEWYGIGVLKRDRILDNLGISSGVLTMIASVKPPSGVTTGAQKGEEARLMGKKLVISPNNFKMLANKRVGKSPVKSPNRRF